MTGGKPNTPEVFWASVRRGSTTECWEWTRVSLNRGYGILRWGRDSKKALAHRISYSLAHPDWDWRDCVLHRCDNRLCVNPDHLFLGTRSDNQRDMVEKGRSVNLRGEQHGMAKLTAEQVLEIRTSPIGAKGWAKRYGVKRSIILAIRKRESWKHL